MARVNVSARNQTFTHEGAPAVPGLSPELQLRRSVLSCFLWEDEFYEDGKQIAQRITENAEKVKPEILAALAGEARNRFHLRHAPLLLLEVLSRTGPQLMSDAVASVVQRADEMGELTAIILAAQKARGQAKRKFPHGLIKGIRKALLGFDEYQLAKYDRDGAFKLRDILRIGRPKPATDEQAALWGRAVKRELATPDTWEVELSAGKDKCEVFTRLLIQEKLGYLALLRNLRNMAEARVDPDLVKAAIIARKGARHVFPFRYVAAARAAPQFEPALDQALVEAIAEMPVLTGKTIVLVDVSDSMNAKLSGKSDMTRMDAAATLGSIIPGDLRVFTFSNQVVEVPPRRGMAGVDAIRTSQEHGGTYLGKAVQRIDGLTYDRLIVITDEQSHDPVMAPRARGYMINVASAKNGVGYGRWTHIDGFSEGVLRFIRESESDGGRMQVDRD